MDNLSEEEQLFLNFVKSIHTEIIYKCKSNRMSGIDMSNFKIVQTDGTYVLKFRESTLGYFLDRKNKKTIEYKCLICKERHSPIKLHSFEEKREVNIDRVGEHYYMNHHWFYMQILKTFL